MRRAEPRLLKQAATATANENAAASQTADDGKYAAVSCASEKARPIAASLRFTV